MFAGSSCIVARRVLQLLFILEVVPVASVLLPPSDLPGAPSQASDSNNERHSAFQRLWGSRPHGTTSYAFPPNGGSIPGLAKMPKKAKFAAALPPTGPPLEASPPVPPEPAVPPEPPLLPVVTESIKQLSRSGAAETPAPPLPPEPPLPPVVTESTKLLSRSGAAETPAPPLPPEPPLPPVVTESTKQLSRSGAAETPAPPLPPDPPLPPVVTESTEQLSRLGVAETPAPPVPPELPEPPVVTESTRQLSRSGAAQAQVPPVPLEPPMAPVITKSATQLSRTSPGEISVMPFSLEKVFAESSRHPTATAAGVPTVPTLQTEVTKDKDVINASVLLKANISTSVFSALHSWRTPEHGRDEARSKQNIPPDVYKAVVTSILNAEPTEAQRNGSARRPYCSTDEQGFTIGCNVGCACGGWSSQCFPYKFDVHAVFRDGKPTKAIHPDRRVVDAGICEPSLFVLSVISVLIFTCWLVSFLCVFQKVKREFARGAYANNAN